LRDSSADWKPDQKEEERKKEAGFLQAADPIFIVFQNNSIITQLE
jgi:hypothetical protein